MTRLDIAMELLKDKVITDEAFKILIKEDNECYYICKCRCNLNYPYYWYTYSDTLLTDDKPVTITCNNSTECKRNAVIFKSEK